MHGNDDAYEAVNTPLKGTQVELISMQVALRLQHSAD